MLSIVVGPAGQADAAVSGDRLYSALRPGCVRYESNGNSVHSSGAESSVSSGVRIHCDGTAITGLTAEELWNLRCYGENYGFNPYQPGDKVEYVFEPIVTDKLERLIEIREAITDTEFESHDLEGDWDWDDHNRYFPTAELDVTQVYVTVHVKCIPIGDPGFDWGILLIRPVTDFVDPIAIRGLAEAQIELPEPDVASNPPLDERGRHGVVHIPTWLWIENPWTGVGPEEAEDGPAEVKVMAFPSYVAWDMGNRDQKTCTGPGVPWASGMAEDETYCSYTYRSSSASSGDDAAFDLKATAHYTYVWWVNDVYLGPYAPGSATTEFTYQVGEIQAVES